MKESANLNIKPKIIEAFKLLKCDYPDVKLEYSSTDKNYWHFALLNERVLYSVTIDALTEHDVKFAVIISKNKLALEL